jgi:hypothetical protein
VSFNLLNLLHWYCFRAICTDEVGAPPALSAEEGVMETRAECRQVLLPCKDNKCYCCIGGGTRQCYATLAECRHACLPLNTN